MRTKSLFFLLILFSGCGYRFSPEFSNQKIPTVSVPYIEGDDDGTLTAELIRTLTASGLADIRSHDAEYRLKVKIENFQNQTIGYRRDKQKVSGEVRKNIVGREGRKSITAVFSLYKKNSEEIASGPFTLSADTDYDYVDGDSIQDLAFINSEGTSTVVLPFSLGQLESIESAQEASTKPLYEKLSQKIADTLFSALAQDRDE